MTFTIRKRTFILSLIFVILLGISLWIYDHYLWVFCRVGNHRGFDLSAVVDMTLGIPGEYNYTHLHKITDDMHISEEEWNKPTCIPIENKEPPLDALSSPKKVYPNGVAPLKNCIIIYGYNGTVEPYCNHKNIKSCIILEIYEYILQRPDILNKLIDIVERPCRYIPTEEKIKEYSIKKGVTMEGTLINMKQIRESLRCDIKDKELETVVIRFLDKDMKPRFNMAIKRKE